MKNRSFYYLAFLLFLISCTGGFNEQKAKGDAPASGCNIDAKAYENVEVFEALAVDGNKNSLPPKVSLLPYAPGRRSQGQQGSCVAWATAYAACSINEAIASGRSGDEVAFSPSFLYNQIGHNNCYGSYTLDALETVKNKGLVFFDRFPYNETDCSRMPSSSLFAEAKQYRIKGYTRLTEDINIYAINKKAIKHHLAQGAPIVISMATPHSFLYEMFTKPYWKPARGEENYTFEYFTKNNQTGYNCHAMCLIGYDDNKYGGAFHIMNSWGDNWGENGLFWISYADFEKYGIEAYGLSPSEKKAKLVSEPDFSVSFGLVDAANSQNIPLMHRGGNLFQTEGPIRKNSKFKIEVSNTEACYIYIFGQETDGSTYILFPYLKEGETKSKYSPYCGIVGTRHFPSGAASLRPDEIGVRDYMAVVVSKEELDYTELNARINAAPGNNLEAKLKNALGNKQFKNPKFQKDASVVSFKAKSDASQQLLGVVLAIEKF